MDATKDWKTLSNFCGSVPPAYPTQEPADQLPKLYCPPRAPFGLVHFTEYPPNLAYSEFTLEEILIYNPEARTRKTETIYREGIKITRPLLLFRNKYNYLPAYLVPMTPPLTLQPNCLKESVAAKKSTSTQIFGVMYITLTGLIGSMVPASGPWALRGKFLSYIVKLAPILWWALPAGSQAPPTGWIPEIDDPDVYLVSMHQRSAPKNIAPEQKGYTTLLEDPVNKRISCASAILPPKTQATCPAKFLLPDQWNSAH
ncbi:hypothetical protein DSO57_1035727 [Entomophthora muscae]|uniref:Uncharacterized protein n=1 Tax=Entomophthora muscae TaxID=34485 RepID=A0ACC2SZG5_9FUNG|nr:hypothetical protein DSO57_1035727 [Entomophthora muscae]